MASDMKKCKLGMAVLAFQHLESSSDDDSEIDLGRDLTQILSVHMVLKRNGRTKRHRQNRYIQQIVTQFRVDEYKTFFRVGRTSVQFLLGTISQICRDENITGITDRISTGGTGQVPLPDRLLMVLWYMASLDRYSSIGDRFGVSESTACCAVRNILAFIREHMIHKFVVWPTEHEQQEISDMYEEVKHFPGVIGMIDGTHIPVRKPSERGIDYYNRKNFYSVVLQAVVREDLRFIDIYTGWPGKVHDARVFRHSPLYTSGQVYCGNRHLLGDSAYPNLPWLLTPFRDTGQLTPAQQRYNKCHASIRSNVERAFGMFKGRFTRLQYIDQRNMNTTVDTIITGCVLHNICILNDEEVIQFLQDDPVPQCGLNAHNYPGQERGARKRLEIARRL